MNLGLPNVARAVAALGAALFIAGCPSAPRDRDGDANQDATAAFIGVTNFAVFDRLEHW